MKRDRPTVTVTVKNPKGGELEIEGDYVSVSVSTMKGTRATSDETSPSFTFLPVAVSWVILVAIMALRIYFTFVISENNIKLTAEIQELNDAYCPLKDNKRMCEPCQFGWVLNQISCYAINDAESVHRKTWEEAREDCRGKISDLAVIDNEDAKKFINTNSWGSSGTNGYWIGLRVEDGRWKWINGSDLTDKSWIAPTNGHCAISVHDEGWKSVRCDKKQQWICQKEALSV
ncbi:hypothetical protein PAMA_015652 [Pampus argenteus]